MKIIIDTDTCKKEGKEVDVILYLCSLLSGNRITVNTFEKARQKGFLKFTKMYDRRFPFPETVSLSDTGEHLAESIMADSNTKESSEDRITKLADALRELFPAGRKPGYAYTWRDSTSCIVDRLKKFFLKYGEYKDEDIIRATKDYVASFHGNYQYMQLLKYFIWKNKVTGEEVVRGRIVGEVERQSQLAAWLEDNKESKHIDTNWDITLK